MFSNNSWQQTTRPRDFSQALSAFMSAVYLWMVVGITISGLTAWFVSTRPEIVVYMLQNPFLFYGMIIAQLGLVIAITGWVQRMSVAMASFIYVTYATLVGFTFSSIFLVYTHASIASAFAVTAFAFAGLSVFGYTTKKDLGPIASFCIMGLFGMIGVMLVSLIFPSIMSNTMQMVYSAVGVIVFSGLTAYDTQRIKALQFQYASSGQARKGAIYGALVLYLDFINLFLSILRLMGDRR